MASSGASYTGATTEFYQPESDFQEHIEQVVNRDEQSVDFISKYDGASIKQYQMVEALRDHGVPIIKICTVITIKAGHFSIRFRRNDPIRNKLPQTITIDGCTFVQEGKKL
jgi:hypothetical protein